MEDKNFNLDAALKSWLKHLRKFEGYEDGQIYEIEDHIRSEVAHLCAEGLQEKTAFEQAINNFGNPGEVNHEMSKLKARSNLLFYLPSALKIAIRKVRRNSLLNWLNIMSLSIGLGTFLFICLFINYEYSFDRHHENGKRIYRLELDLFQSGQWTPSSTNSYLIGEVVQRHLLAIENMVQIIKGQGTFSYQHQKFKEKRAAIVSSTFFDVFSADFIYGNKETAFNDPNDIVLDHNVAKKYFGDKNPIGEQLLLENYERLMTVSAVIEPIPANSHFSFDLFVSFDGVKDQMNEQVFTNPGWTLCYNYLLLEKGTDIDQLEALFPKILENHVPTFDNNNLKLRLRPLHDIHFHAHSGEELSPNRDFKQIKILSYIGFAILFLTLFNYINLSTARYQERIKEIGIRKIFGAEKRSIRVQFWSESLMYTFIAFLMAGLFILITFPLFNDILDSPIRLRFGWLEVLAILVFWLLLSLLISLHPAIVLPGIKISNALSKKMGISNSAGFRKVLLSFQFGITIAILSGLGIMFRQVNFLQSSDPGFRKEGVFSFLKGGMNEEKNEAIKTELLKDPAIQLIGRSSISMPGPLQSSTFFKADSVPDSPENVIKAVYVDDQFFQALELQLASGLHFDRKKGNGQIILNEKAVEKFGWSKPLEKGFSPKSVEWKGQVVGVAKDFNFESLYNEIIPVVFVHDPGKTNWMYARYQGDIRKILPRVRDIVRQFYPEYDVQPVLMDESIANQYRADQILMKLAGIFTLLTILISGMGIFGMAFFTTQRKTKEIAIRKVIGASTPQLYWLLTNSLIGILMIATLFASPLAYVMGNRWLTAFPYRIELSPGLFLSAIFFTIILTLLASGIVVLKAALQNPVKSLRYE